MVLVQELWCGIGVVLTRVQIKTWCKVNLIVKWRYEYKLKYEIILDELHLFNLNNELNIRLYYKLNYGASYMVSDSNDHEL